MANSISVSEARQDFAEVVNRVAYGNERVTVVRRGRPDHSPERRRGPVSRLEEARP